MAENDPTKVKADCGRTCRFYSSHTETMDPGVPGSQQTFAECDPPNPEGMSDDEVEAAIEAADASGDACPCWAPVLLNDPCGARCGKTFDEVPVTELYLAMGYPETEYVCSPACGAVVEAKAEREIEAEVAENEQRDDDAERIRARALFPSPCCGKESTIVDPVTVRCGQCGKKWRR